MDLRLLLILLLWGLFVPDGSGEGRDGNRHFRAGRFEEAAQAYLAGLETAEDPAVRARLYQNLGSARYRSESYEGALSAFDEGLRTAGEPELESALAYDAGNAAYRQKELRRAADFYRRALLADPDNRAAKFNYEFVRRQLEKNRSGSSDQNQDDQNQNDENQDSSSGSDRQNSKGSSQNRDSGSDSSQSASQKSEDPSGRPGQSEGERQNQAQGADRGGEEGRSRNEPPGDQREGSSQSGEARDGSASPARGQAEAGRLSEQEARRILQALETSEKQLLREMRRAQRERSAPPPEKDW